MKLVRDFRALFWAQSITQSDASTPSNGGKWKLNAFRPLG